MFDYEKKAELLSRPFLYLVTDRSEKRRDHFLATIIKAIQGGVKMVQLREKNASFEEFCEIGLALRAVLKKMEVPLIINDRIDVALAIQAEGVHLGLADANVKEARKQLGQSSIIGLSLEKTSDLEKALNLPVDYVAASPVFSSRTKTDCGPPFGIGHLKSFCSLSTKPVVGIGGIHLENVDEVMECGVKGVALVSAIFDAPCPRFAAQNFVSRLEPYDRRK